MNNSDYEIAEAGAKGGYIYSIHAISVFTRYCMCAETAAAESKANLDEQLRKCDGSGYYPAEVLDAFGQVIVAEAIKLAFETAIKMLQEEIMHNFLKEMLVTPEDRADGDEA